MFFIDTVGDKTLLGGVGGPGAVDGGVKKPSSWAAVLGGGCFETASPALPYGPLAACGSASVKTKKKGSPCIGENKTTDAACLPHGLLLPIGSGINDGTTLVPEQPVAHSNPWTVLEAVNMDGCTRSGLLLGRARALVRFFRSTGLEPVSELPASIECGGLRSAVRSVFRVDDPLLELSFKTIAKVESNCCKNCEPRFLRLLDEWKDARFQPVHVDSEHLQRFRSALRRNVDSGWDRWRQPFIPNGNATRAFKRREGGNWNVEDFSEYARAELVFSSGKPRVVTLYSAENSRVLGPLHYSLHTTLKRKGWLLVGDPTDQDVGRLTGGAFISVDYRSATDNIKAAYVDTALDVLIEKAHNLSTDEIRAMRVLSHLKIDGVEGVATRGQPMGSLLSFPLLCLINKTVADMALCDMLLNGEVSFAEWTRHPLLINGDDLLTREPRAGTAYRDGIVRHGEAVGLVVNLDKTMHDTEKAELNSTLFVNGKRQKKTNASALWMKPDCDDVLGFAAQATTDTKSFVRVVRGNLHILSKQQDKKLYDLPPRLQGVCRKDRKIRRAITALPVVSRPKVEGVILMAPEPDGYHLPREVEHACMVDEICRVRERALELASAPRERFTTSFVPGAQSFSSATRRPMRSRAKLIPACYARRYTANVWKDLVEEGLANPPWLQLAPFDGSVIDQTVDAIRRWRLDSPCAVRPQVGACQEYLSLAV